MKKFAIKNLNLQPYNFVLKLIFFVFLSSLLFIDVNAQSLKNNNDLSNNRKLNKVSLSIISYNVWGLPIWLPGIKKKKRFPKIIENLKKTSADIVCLQETFDFGFRKKHLSKLKDTYTFNKNYLVNRKSKFMKFDKFGGLTTLSKVKVLEETFYQFDFIDGMSKVEKDGGKGFMLTKLKTPVGPIYIINVHLLSGEDTKKEKFRLSQVKKIKSIADSLNVFDFPTFLCGDLNTVHPSRDGKQGYIGEVYKFLVENIGFKGIHNKITEEDFTFDAERNKNADRWYYKEKHREKLDYFMYAVPDDYLFEVEENKVIFNKENTTSDHFGVMTKIFLQKKE